MDVRSASDAARVAWVDVAKGICICLVVMMHSTLGVEKAAGETGWLGHAVAFAKPFRMPDFFLISGLFLASRIDAPWRLYLDRKVVHFAYFYVLWLTIQFAFRAPGIAADAGASLASPAGFEAVGRDYLFAFVDPFGTLWFIYHLALFMLVTRAVKNVPWPLVWCAAAALEMAPIATGSMVIDEFAARYVYFYSGYVFAAHVFRFADEAAGDRSTTIAGLTLWALLNGVLVALNAAGWPLVSLALGFAGALAIVALSTVLLRTAAGPTLAWLGEHSIVIYLSFFLPMAATRTVLLKTGPVADLGTVSLLVTAAGIVAPVLFYLTLRRLGWGLFLFERPAWAHIDRKPSATADPPPAILRNDISVRPVERELLIAAE